jgi:hypothetical protein
LRQALLQVLMNLDVVGRHMLLPAHRRLRLSVGGRDGPSTVRRVSITP